MGYPTETSDSEEEDKFFTCGEDEPNMGATKTKPKKKTQRKQGCMGCLTSESDDEEDFYSCEENEPNMGATKTKPKKKTQRKQRTGDIDVKDNVNLPREKMGATKNDATKKRPPKKRLMDNSTPTSDIGMKVNIDLPLEKKSKMDATKNEPNQKSPPEKSSTKTVDSDVEDNFHLPGKKKSNMDATKNEQNQTRLEIRQGGRTDKKILPSNHEGMGTVSRPLYIADRFYTSVYENDWCEAFDELAEKHIQKEYIPKILLELCMVTFNTSAIVSASSAMPYCQTVMRQFLELEAFQMEKTQQSMVTVEKMDTLKRTGICQTERDLGDLCKRLVSLWNTKKDNITGPEVNNFIIQCWLFSMEMHSQNPPMFMDTPLCDSTFNPEIHNPYKSDVGKYVSSYVWPVLYLNKGGVVILKGVVRLQNEKRGK